MTIQLRCEQGTLLAATPQMLDPNFVHSVVLMCQHSGEGAYGLVINRRSDYTTRTLLAQHPLLGKYDHPIYIGGPVQLNAMQILHRVPERISGGVELVSGLWIGGELDQVARFIAEEERAEDRVRLLVGYSGWGAGQLDGELALGSWLPAPGAPEHVFHSEPQSLWKEVLKDIKSDLQGLGGEPPDPQWN
jgi:putative transcriptional regulator